MTSTGDPKEPRALTAFVDLTRAGADLPSEAELDRGLDSLLVRIGGGRSRHRRVVGWSLVGALATLGALTVWQVRDRAGDLPAPMVPPLAYRIEGGQVLAGGYLGESGHQGIKLSFNEGSELALMPGTRGRLRTLHEAEARVAIEQGTASFRITPSRQRHWLVEVGPFLVAVKGTTFTVAWDPASERFELRLRHGNVVVSGPISGGDLALRAGQRLVVSVPKAEALITEDRTDEQPAEQASAPAEAPTPAAVTVPTVRRPPASQTLEPKAASKTATARPWADELANGRWDRILEDVERAGVTSALATSSSDELFALADAARYRRRTDLARAALLALRRRFPDSPRTLDALFLLGRVEETHHAGLPRAIAWFDEYLARAPAGAYAAEALGRKMILTNELGGSAAARPIAEAYLRRFPDGSYAGSARALGRGP